MSEQRKNLILDRIRQYEKQIEEGNWQKVKIHLIGYEEIVRDHVDSYTTDQLIAARHSSDPEELKRILNDIKMWL